MFMELGNNMSNSTHLAAATNPHRHHHNSHHTHNRPTTERHTIPITSPNDQTTPESSTAPANKFAPARRLAARQTLRLAIPKQSDVPYALQNPGNTANNSIINNNGGSFAFRCSPSQLPPAPLLKRNPYIPKSASPLESHALQYDIQGTHAPSTDAMSTLTPTKKYLGLRKPSITLQSVDLRNNKVLHNSDRFVFSKDLSPAMDMSDHSPIFTSPVSASTSSGSRSPIHHFNQLFSLSPSNVRSYGNMSDLSDDSHGGAVNSASSLAENCHKKSGSAVSQTPELLNSVSVVRGAGRGADGDSTVSVCNNGVKTASLGRQINTSSSSSSSLKETLSSSTSQKVVNSSSSSTTTRVEKTSQRLHHITSSSTSSTSSSPSSSSEMKTEALKRDLSEIKSSMLEINDLARGPTAAITAANNNNNNNNHNNNNSHTISAMTSTSHPSAMKDFGKLNALNSADAFSELKKKIRSSIENIVDSSDEPVITFPDGDDDHGMALDLMATNKKQLSANGLSGSNKTIDTVKFEEKRTKTESKTKVVADGFSSEEATSNLAQMKRLQTGDIDYKEATKAAAMQKRLETDGVKTEESAAIIQEALSLRSGDVTQQASNNVAAASIKVQSDTFSADKKAISQSQQSQMMTSNGIISQSEKHSTASQSNFTMTHKGVSSTGSSMISSSAISTMKLADLKLDDLTALTSTSGQREVEQAISKYSNMLTSFVGSLQDTKAVVPEEKSLYLEKINEVMRRAWEVPTHGHELGYSLCNSLRQSGGLDMLMVNCLNADKKIKFSSAQLLEQCLTTENRAHVVDNGLDKVVNVACVCTKEPNTEHSRIGTGILEHLFKHSEGTCSDVIKLGGLDAVLFECRTSDVETLRHCASALANLSLYGGADNQEAMIDRKVPMWLFPLAFHTDDSIKYYACLAIAVLVANKEIEAEVLKSGCLNLVEPFVTARDPSEFAKSNSAHAHGQSKHWLQRLVPVLSSNREEARSLAAFHFCMEAGIKRQQGNTEIFREIGAIEALKTVASCPNAIASKFAAQALRLIGETVPHKLSQQVPLWSVEDVQEWVKQIGFGLFVKQFEESQVDGDLLLKLNKENLSKDIGICNGILLKRFERELHNLKRMADYSSKDTERMHHFLSSIGPEYCTYTYAMLNAGIDRNSLPQLNEDMLRSECGIENSIHRFRILLAVKNLENSLPNSSEESLAKTLDVFVSYRRSNGSQLASLLKVHLQLRGFSVFIDVERLEAGKFDNGLLNSIRQAKNFVLVLSPNALERCVQDDEGKDWVHREIVAALDANCNIIPVIDSQFKWPEIERLPEDMRSVCHFNGVTWSHDYQDACIEKLERFMRGEKIIDRIPMAPGGAPGPSVAYQRMHSNDSDYQSNCGGGVGSSGVIAGNCSGGGGGNNGGGSTPNVVGAQANHQANRYRQSSSPARQRGAFGGGGGGGGGSAWCSSGQLGVLGSGRNGSKQSLKLTPFRTQQTAHKPISGSMQNVVPLAHLPPRRSSAVSMSNGSAEGGKHTLPSGRSHSVDGMLEGGGSSDSASEKRVAEMAALVAAGSTALTCGSSTDTLQPNDDYNCSMGSLAGSLFKEPGIETVAPAVPKRDKPGANLPPTNPQHRKSRSLDHFLDEKTLVLLTLPTEPNDGTQSMHNLATPITPNTSRGVRTQPFHTAAGAMLRDAKSHTPERKVPSVNVKRPSPDGISSADDDAAQLRHSGNSSTGSCTSRGDVKSQTRAAASLHRGNQSSKSSSINSNTSTGATLGPGTATNANGKTIFNRTLKKVRSLMKKP